MQREYPSTPLVAVGAVIVGIQEGEARVAVIRRGSAPLKGEWSVPGGVLELGETVREATVREAFEETGLVVECRDVLGVFDRVIRDEDGKVRFHYVLVDFLCRRISGRLHAGHDAADARWLTRTELLALPMEEMTREVLLKGFERIVQTQTQSS